MHRGRSEDGMYPLQQPHPAAERPFDVAVIGGGLGGLAAAALAQRAGLRAVLMEAHTKLGGCAGYFERGPFTFDAGATALMGLGPGEPVGAFLATIGLDDFEAVRTPSYRVHLPDRVLDIVPDAGAFETACRAAFPGREAAARRRFWRWQGAVGRRLFDAAARGPRLPLRSPADLVHDLRALGAGGTLAAATSLVTVEDVLRLLGLDRDRPFRALIAMLLQDTAQAGPETVPFAQAAACLEAYRRGLCRPRGGMRALADGIAGRFTALGGELRTATLVDRVEPGPDGAGFTIATRRRQRVRARRVVFDLPLDRAAALLGRDLGGRLGRLERKARAAWGAFTGYLAVRREAVPDDSPLFHQVLMDYGRPIHDGNNVLVSLAPVADEGYGPPGVRVATLSTHVRPSDWKDLDRDGHARRKGEYARRLRAALERALPGSADALVHAEFGTPRSFARYIRRTAGAVGGPPVARGNSGLLAVGPDVLGPGLWLVGDSVFPGQGTMAVVMSAARVVERLVSRPRTAPWVVDGHRPDRAHPVRANHPFSSRT